jgi:hypothetical protein
MNGHSVKGKIVAFDRDTCVGIAVYDLTSVRFHSTSYQGLTQSWPIVGQTVEIVFNGRDQLVAVHAVP